MGVTPIKTKLEASANWRIFNDKHSRMMLEVVARHRNQKTSVNEQKRPENKPEEIEEKPSLSEKEKYSEDEAARIIQKNMYRQLSLWRMKHGHERTIPVNLQAKHNRDFDFLIHGEAVRRAPGLGIANFLKEELQKGNWEHPLFQSPWIESMALSAFAANKITYQQCCSILERVQTLGHANTEESVFKHTGTFPILDDRNQFTNEAKAILINSLKHPHEMGMPKITDQQLEEFRLYVATLPESERFFYTTTMGQLTEDKQTQRGRGRLLGEEMIGLDALLVNNNQLVHLTSGARDALGIARFGMDEYVKAMPRFGKFSREDIEEGVVLGGRYATISYPGTIPYRDGDIHGYKRVTPMEALAHDIYHSNLMSMIPKKYLITLQYMTNVLRGAFKNQIASSASTGTIWSREIWEWVDSNLAFAQVHYDKLHPDKLTPQKLTELFCEIVSYGHLATFKKNGELVDKPTGGYIYKLDEETQKPILRPSGIMLFLDMVKNPKQWAEMGIDPRYFTKEFKTFYNDIKTIYPKIKDEAPNLQYAKCLLHSKLRARGKEKLFDLLAQIITNESSLVTPHLKLEKNTKAGNFVEKNTIVLTYKGQVLQGVNDFTLLLQDIYKHKNPGASLDDFFVTSLILEGEKSKYLINDLAILKGEVKPKGEDLKVRL